MAWSGGEAAVSNVPACSERSPHAGGANAHLESWRRAGGRAGGGSPESPESEKGRLGRNVGRERERASNAGTGETTDCTHIEARRERRYRRDIVRVCVSHSVDLGDSITEPFGNLGRYEVEGVAVGVGRRRSSGRRAAAYWAAAYWRRLSRFPSRAFCVVRKEREGAEREREGAKERESSFHGVHFMTSPPHDAFTRDTARLTSSNVYIHLGRDIHCPPPAFAPFACLVCWILLGWISGLRSSLCMLCVSEENVWKGGSEEARKRQGRHARNGTTK